MADLDDDDIDEKDDGDGPQPSPAPAAPAAPGQPDLKALLYQQLAARQAAQNNPQYLNTLSQDRLALQQGVGQNGLAALLAQSAAQAGSIGGKTANAAPVAQMGQQLNQAALTNQQMLESETARQDKMRDMLYQQLSKQAGLEFQDKKLKETSGYHQATLAAKAHEGEENRASHKDMQQANIDMKNAVLQGNAGNRADASQARQDNQTEQQFERFGQRLQGTVRDSVGAEKTKLRAATHAMSIIEGSDFNQLSPIQVQELSGAMAQQVTQGSPAQGTLHNMTPKSAPGDLAKVFEYITGSPAPANQGDFVQQFKNMLQRQVSTSQNIIQGEISPVVANYAGLRQKDPKRFNDMMQAAGIQMDDKGTVTAYQPSYAPKNTPESGPKPEGGTAIAAPAGKTPPAAEVHPEANRAKAWAEQNLMSPDAATATKARAILQRLGVAGGG